MNLALYQQGANSHRFILPNQIWEQVLPPPALAILAYLCFLRQHGTTPAALPDEAKLAAQLHMSAEAAAEHTAALICGGLLTAERVPTILSTNTAKFFSLPNELFSLGLGHGPITIYAYLLYCEDRRTHQCHPSYRTISNAVGLTINTVAKHVAKLEARRLIAVERTSYLDRHGMKWNSNNLYTIRPIQQAIDCFNERQMARLEAAVEKQRVARKLAKRDRAAPCVPPCAASKNAPSPSPTEDGLDGSGAVSEDFRRTKEKAG